MRGCSSTKGEQDERKMRSRHAQRWTEMLAPSGGIIGCSWSRLSGLVHQTRLWAQCEAQHAAWDKDTKQENKRPRRYCTEPTKWNMRQSKMRLEAARHEPWKKTKGKSRETSCNSRPQRTGLWPRHKSVVAKGDRGPFHQDSGGNVTK